MSYYIYDVNPDNYKSDEEFFHMMVEIENELVDDTEEQKVKDIFDELRVTPFSNDKEHARMLSLLVQLKDLNTPETRRLFKAIGSAFNDLADNGKLDGSSYPEPIEEVSNLGIPGTNLTIKKLGKDVNGNKTLYLQTSTGRNIRIQTNGNIPESHRKSNINEIASDPKTIQEIKNYIKEYDSKEIKFNESILSSRIVKEFEKTANKEKSKGAKVEINYRLPYVSIKRSDGSEYFFQTDEASDLLDEIPDNINTEDYLLAIAYTW